jgi:hypothetical protein
MAKVYNIISTNKLYCQPKDLTITVEQANDIVVRWAQKRTDNIEGMPIALALLGGLRETFPCPPN